MPHLVMGNRVMTVGEPAWHRIGANFPKGTVFSAEDALKVIDPQGEVIIDKIPFTIDIPGYGPFQPEDRYAVVRRPTSDDPNPRVFNTVGASYGVLQNAQIAQIVDTLVSATGWKIETAGILDHGAKIFFCLKNGDTSVSGDDIGIFFAVSDNRTGTESVDLCATPVRYVCWNTMSLGLSAADEMGTRIRIPHHADLLSEVSWRVDVIAKLVASGESMVNALRKLDKVDVTLERFSDILVSLFPLPKKPRSVELTAAPSVELRARGEKAEYMYAWACNTIETQRKEIVENFRYLSEGDKGNGWHAFNAVTGFIDHQWGKNTPNGRRVAAERALSKEGDALRTKAYNLIMGIAD